MLTAQLTMVTYYNCFNTNIVSCRLCADVKSAENYLLFQIFQCYYSQYLVPKSCIAIIFTFIITLEQWCDSVLRTTSQPLKPMQHNEL